VNYALLADMVLLLHIAVVLFVITMVPLILIGGVRDWHWTRRRRLRLVHVACVILVAAQSCPLTTLEMWLRTRAGRDAYAGSFIEYYLHKLLYWDLPPWVFVTVYTVFVLGVLLSWLLVPPAKLADFDHPAAPGSRPPSNDK
jgi:hypothetical protein